MSKNVLGEWMALATPLEKKELARLAGSTLGALRQAAGVYRTGVLRLTPEFSVRLADASIVVAREGLPVLLQSQLSAVCGSCRYTQIK